MIALFIKVYISREIPRLSKSHEMMNRFINIIHNEKANEVIVLLSPTSQVSFL